LVNLTDDLPELAYSEKLQEFRALGSSIKRTSFAPGAPLHTVHLPKTMTTLSFVQNKDLNNILVSRPEIVRFNESTGLYDYTDPDTYRGLYLEGITDYDATKENEGHSVSTLDIQGGGLGYNSYTILNNLYMLKHEANTNNLLSIGLTDVEWTPYIEVEKGTPYDDTEDYYLLTDHSSYEPYGNYISDEKWLEQTTNRLVYTYNPLYLNTNIEQTITNLDLLDAFIESYQAATRSQNPVPSKFSNLVGTTEATMPTITGNLYVSNDSEHKVTESSLTNRYAQYFPHLSITAKWVQESNVTKYARYYEDTNTTEVIEALRSDDTKPQAPTKNIPSKPGCDFVGWSLDLEGNNIVLPYIVDVNTGGGDYIQKLVKDQNPDGSPLLDENN